MTKAPVNVQPKATGPMNASQAQEKEWEEGLLAQCNPCSGSCWFATCCSCCALQRNYNRYKYLHGDDKDADLNGKCGCCCCGELVLGSFFLHGVMPLILRQRIRDLLRIRGRTYKDCFATWCCLACSLSQESKELEAGLQRKGVRV